MDLEIEDVVNLLNVSEETVKRWIEGGKIPSYQLQGTHRFSRIEIENWMMQNGLPPQEEGRKGTKQFGLYRAIHRGGVHTIAGDSKEALITQSIHTVAEPLDLDADLVSELFLDRESLMPTALGGGIAVPHTRDFLLKGPHDVVTVVYPEEPLDWGALDEQPIHTLFFLFACDDKRHLSLLAKLAHLAANEEAHELLRSRPNQKDLLDYLKHWEATLTT